MAKSKSLDFNRSARAAGVSVITYNPIFTPCSFKGKRRGLAFRKSWIPNLSIGLVIAKKRGEGH
jgi:hypothetical protein